MTELRDLLIQQAHRIEPSPDGLDRMIKKVRRREARRRWATSVVALAIGLGGALVAIRAFSEPTADPAEGAGSNYIIQAGLARPEDLQGNPAQGPDFQWIQVDVRWDPHRYPGVRRCTWRVLDASGTVIGDRRNLYAATGSPTIDIEEGEAQFSMKIFPVRGEPATAEAFCQGERLDTPGIAEVDPVPPSIARAGEMWEFLDERLIEWTELYAVDSMSTDQLAGNLWAIWQQLRDPPRGGSVGELDHLAIQERGLRMGALCTRLPLGHEFRNGEFCDSGARLREGDGQLPPPDRFIAGQGEAAGTRWEIFALQTAEGPAIGFHMDTGEWGFTETPDPDPCRIVSEGIHWLHLREDPTSIVVLQFSALAPEADSVRFELSDGRSVPAEILEIPDRIAPWDAFAVVFEGPRDISVFDILIKDAEGGRLNGSAVC